MPNTAALTCASCGAENLSTRFCESCGAPASGGVVAPVPAAASAAMSLPVGLPAMASALPPIRNSPLHVAALILYASFVVIPALVIAIAYISGNFGGLSAGTASSVVLAVLTGMFAALAGFTAPQSPGRKVAAGLLGIAFMAFPILTAFSVSWGFTTGPVFGGGAGLSMVSALLAPLLLFLSWAIARQFRGRGYFALLIGTAFIFAGSFVDLIPGIYSNYLGGTIASVVFSLITIAATVGSAVAFENAAAHSAASRPTPSPAAPAGNQPAQAAPAASPVAPYAPAAGQVAHTNGFAIASLVLGLVGATWIAILFGYLAKSQIRRTGESGSGMATAGLILGYVGLVVVVVLTIVYVVYLVSVANALNGLRYSVYQ